MLLQSKRHGLFEIWMQFLSSSSYKLAGFSMGTVEETSINDKPFDNDKGASNSEKQETIEQYEYKYERFGIGLTLYVPGGGGRSARPFTNS